MTIFQFIDAVESVGLLPVFEFIASIFSKHNIESYRRCRTVNEGSGSHRENVLDASIAHNIDERQLYRAERDMNQTITPPECLMKLIRN